MVIRVNFSAIQRAKAKTVEGKMYRINKDNRSEKGLAFHLRAWRCLSFPFVYRTVL